MMDRLIKLSEEYHKNPFTEAAEYISTQAAFPEDMQAIASAFAAGDWTSVCDDILFDYFGDRFMRSNSYLDMYLKQTVAYLYPRLRYIAQQLEYIASEYNPIENYRREESEDSSDDIKQHRSVVTDVIAQQKRTITDDMDARKDTLGYDTLKTTSTQTFDDLVATNQVAPFESSEFFNESKSVTDGREDEIVSETDSREDTVDHAAYEDTHTIIDDAHTDTHTTTEDPHKDEHSRYLIASGNIGTMTAAQMLEGDEAFWKSQGAWCFELAHDLANILTIGVMML